MAGLYVHVPFCVRKCRYCDFYSVPTEGAPASAAPRYLEALDRELAGLPDGFRPETVFLGGGTPTELSEPELRRLLGLLRARVDLSAAAEWTCEANPGTLTPAKTDALREAGVNRASLGVQSFDAATLAFLGRMHTAEEAVAGFRLLRAAGFDNVNLDLMYAVPGGTAEGLERDLDELVSLGPEHAACYGLIFEDGTPLAALRARGAVRAVDEEDELAQYARVRARLGAAGYRHYEISNFARPGRECRHNRLYWSGGEYLGVGPAAHSHWDGARRGNVRNLADYCDRLLAGGGARAFEERLEPEAKARETLVMSLRLLDGVERAAFRARTGFDYLALGGEALAWLGREGLVEEDGERLRLTERGVVVSDAVFAELV